MTAYCGRSMDCWWLYCCEFVILISVRWSYETWALVLISKHSAPKLFMSLNVWQLFVFLIYWTTGLEFYSFDVCSTIPQSGIANAQANCSTTNNEHKRTHWIDVNNQYSEYLLKRHPKVTTDTSSSSIFPRFPDLRLTATSLHQWIQSIIDWLSARQPPHLTCISALTG